MRYPGSTAEMPLRSCNAGVGQIAPIGSSVKSNLIPLAFSKAGATSSTGHQCHGLLPPTNTSRSGTEGQLQAALDDLGWYRREIDNLRAALNWAFASGGDAAVGVALAATGADFGLRYRWSPRLANGRARRWRGSAPPRERAAK